MLFRSKFDKLSKEIRINVFQNYFTEEVLDKIFWITTNRTFTINEIYKFGNFVENEQFLLKHIKKNKNHFRVKISALLLLNEFQISNVEKTKKTFITLLKNKSEDIGVKAQIIRTLKNKNILER